MGLGSWRGGLLHEVVAHVLSMHELEGQAGWKADNECVHPSLSPQVHASFFYVQVGKGRLALTKFAAYMQTRRICKSASR